MHELNGAFHRLPWVTGLWGLGLLVHGFYVVKLARHENQV